VGSKTFDGVWFEAYSDDHLLPHVHGYYAGVQVIVELVDGRTRLSRRRKAIRPPGAKQSDVSKILRTATQYAAELADLWKVTHG